MCLFLKMGKPRHKQIKKKLDKQAENVEESPDFLSFIPLVIQCTKSEQPDWILIWLLNAYAYAEAFEIFRPF